MNPTPSTPSPTKSVAPALNVLRRLAPVGLSLGCDPELFLVDAKGRVVGSERVLPANAQQGVGNVVTDGVQVELHPGPGSCREGLAGRISEALNVLRAYADTGTSETGPLKVSFDQVVRVRKAELALLSPKAQNLGCGPSLSAYGTPPIEVNGLLYRRRSAAGHIHLDTGGTLVGQGSHGVVDPVRAVQLMDIIVGNTCVLLEPDPLKAKERRRYYGRAGEYRLPKYGLEYRVPSNFWLQSYPLMSLVTSLVRQAYYVAVGPSMHKRSPTTYPASQFYMDADEVLLGSISLDAVQEAINTCNKPLAWSIFREHIRPLLFDRISSYEGLHATNVDAFEAFAEKPLTHWFPGDVITNWAYRGDGWERFAQGGPQSIVVQRKRDAAFKKAAPSATFGDVAAVQTTA